MRIGLAAIALALVVPSAASASVRIYTDEASFVAALTNTRTANYNALGNGFYGGGIYGVGNLTYNGINVRSVNNLVFTQANNAYRTGTFASIQQAMPTDFTITNPSAVNALGFNVAGGRPVTIQFGSDIVTLPIRQYPTFSYIGLISDDLASTVAVHSEGGGVDLDNVTFGTGAQPVVSPDDFVGGTPDDPRMLSGVDISDVGGFISGTYPSQAFVGFDWAGGRFSALGSLTGADTRATFDFQLFATGAPLVPLASVTLSATNGFSGFLDQTLAAGAYSIGYTTTSQFDPSWHIRFVTPVSGAAAAVPEPTSWAFMILGLIGIGAVLRPRPTRQAQVD